MIVSRRAVSDTSERLPLHSCRRGAQDTTSLRCWQQLDRQLHERKYGSWP